MIASDSTANLRPSFARIGVLALIILTAAGIRMHQLCAEAFGFDELFSVHFATARGPWETALPVNQWMAPMLDIQGLADAPPAWRVWTSMGYDTHPPGHALVLRAWMAMFGEGDCAIRALSLVLSLVVLLLVFDAARLAAGWWPGCWAAAIVALMAPQVQYAQEVRSYMMTALLAAAALNVGVRMIVIGPSWRRAAHFGAIAWAAMMTHYFAVGFVVPIALVLLLQLPRSWRWRFAGVCVASAAVFAVTWGPRLVEQRSNFSDNMAWLSDEDAGLFGRAVRKASIVPLRLLFDPGQAFIDSATTGENPTWLVPLLLAGVPLALGWRKPAVWMCAAGAVGPIALVAAADIAQERQTINLIRYTLAAGPAMALLLAIGPSSHRRVFAHCIVGAATLGCALALPRVWDGEKPPWRALVSEACAGVTEDDALVFLSDRKRAWATALVYMAFNRYAPVAPSAVVLDSPADEELIRRLRDCRNVVVVSESAELPIERFLPNFPAPRHSAWVPYAGAYAHVELFDPASITVPASSPAGGP